MSYWRGKAKSIIARVLAETAGRPEKEIRAALLKAYPFGPREYHPYKVWLDEIKRQRKLKPPLGTVTKSAERVQAENPKQERLFR